MKKGFTLIELLAVIVILAIIALIATPIILGIIADARNEAKVRSAELYLTALEQAIIREKMNDTTFNPSSCDINGQIVTCGGETLNVDVDGEKPTSGTITINNGQTEEVKLSYTDLEFETDANNNLVSYERAYEIGEEVTFNPGDGSRTWNVIGETKDTVTLMMSNVLGESIAWNLAGYTSNGPIDALSYLNTLTVDWNNVDPIESYTYVNNLNGTIEGKGYQKLEIEDGVTTVTTKSGYVATIYEIRSDDYEEGQTYEQGETKARLITKEEIETLENKNINTEFLYPYYEDDDDRKIYENYWTLSCAADNGYNWSAYAVFEGILDTGLDVECIGCAGVRPVITIPKTDL